MPAVLEAMNANMPATPNNLRLPQIDPQAEFEQAEGQLRDYLLARRERDATGLRQFREPRAGSGQTHPDAEAAVEVETELR